MELETPEWGNRKNTKYFFKNHMLTFCRLKGPLQFKNRVKPKDWERHCIQGETRVAHCPFATEGSNASFFWRLFFFFTKLEREIFFHSPVLSLNVLNNQGWVEQRQKPQKLNPGSHLSGRGSSTWLSTVMCSLPRCVLVGNWIRSRATWTRHPRQQSNTCHHNDWPSSVSTRLRSATSRSNPTSKTLPKEASGLCSTVGKWIPSPHDLPLPLWHTGRQLSKEQLLHC